MAMWQVSQGKIQRLGILLVIFLATAVANAQSWKYVVPAPNDPMSKPLLRMLPMSEQKLVDVETAVKFRGKKQTYCQLRFGSLDSVRVAVVFDVVSSTEGDLYVDANRDRLIDEYDKVDRDGKIWRTKLDALVNQDSKTKRLTRQVLFQRSMLQGGISFAVLGYLEGEAEFNGKKMLCRRIDADGNGSVIDPSDFFWLDLNSDRKFDPFTEQFVFSSTLTLPGTRYAIKSDPWGERLKLDRIEGEGRLKLRTPANLAAAKIKEYSVNVVSKDGLTANLKADSREQNVPIGDYSPSSLALAMVDAANANIWKYTFSYCGTNNWQTLARNNSLEVDPIGKLDFHMSLNRDSVKDPYSPGDQILVNLRLFTGDGLLINTCEREPVKAAANTRSDSLETRSAPHAVIEVMTSDGKVLDQCHTGFA